MCLCVSSVIKRRWKEDNHFGEDYWEAESTDNWKLFEKFQQKGKQDWIRDLFQSLKELSVFGHDFKEMSQIFPNHFYASFHQILRLDILIAAWNLIGDEGV